MMKKKWLLGWTAATALVPAVAWSAGSAVTMDVYYAIPETDIEIRDLGEVTADEGDGFGVKGRFELGPQVFLAAEYQSNTYDEVEGRPFDAEIDQIRGGAGFRFGPGSPFYLLGEVVHVDAELEGEKSDETGYGIHLGAAAPMSSGLDLYGQIGYVDVDADGLEFLVGLAMMITPQIGAFADYRHTTLEDDDVELTLKDIRVGLRIQLQ